MAEKKIDLKTRSVPSEARGGEITIFANLAGKLSSVDAEGNETFYAPKAITVLITDPETTSIEVGSATAVVIDNQSGDDLTITEFTGLTAGQVFSVYNASASQGTVALQSEGFTFEQTLQNGQGVLLFTVDELIVQRNNQTDTASTATVAEKVIGTGAAVGVSLGDGAGTGAGPAEATGTASGGKIEFPSGTTPPAGEVVFTVTYPAAFPNGSSVILSPASNAASAVSLLIDANNAGFEAVLPAGASLEAETLYAWNFVVIGF